MILRSDLSICEFECCFVNVFARNPVSLHFANSKFRKKRLETSFFQNDALLRIITHYSKHLQSISSNTSDDAAERVGVCDGAFVWACEIEGFSGDSEANAGGGGMGR